MFLLKLIVSFIGISSISAGNKLFKNNLTFEVVFGMFGVFNQTIPTLRKELFKDISNTTTLLLSNDKIEKIEPGSFDYLPNLKVLHISSNRITKIKEGIFNDLKLTTLHLDNNGISTIASTAFDNMTALIGISITKNPLKCWDPNWFTNTPSLIIINVKFNQIEELGPYALKNFQGERTLFLNFGNNKIRTIDNNAFGGVTGLTRISFNNNQLEILSGPFLEGVKIQKLHLSNNKIRCVDDEDLSKIFVANVTYVDGNPWDCDCLQKVREWIKINGLKLKVGRRKCGFT